MHVRWTCAMVVLLGCAVATAEAAPAASTQPAGKYAGDAAQIQARLDKAAARGGRVRLKAGRYRIDRPLNIPEGVTLAGVWESPHHAQLARGTVFEVVTGAGQENGPPLIMLNPSSTIKGITFWYPEQQVPEVTPYPWTIQGRGMHCSVIDCTFVNPYKAIDFGTHHNELHYVRNCFGCPLKIGVRVDQCTDIGRLENVHFNPHYWMRAETQNKPTWEALSKYLFANLVAFEFGRTDWEYVFNTFCYGGKVGYRFYESPHGTVNGNFLGIGADWCERAVAVEACQMPGLLITNGEFVGGTGAVAMVEVMKDNKGPVQFSNCSFWGPCDIIAILGGSGLTSFSQCAFLNHGKDGSQPTLEVRSGDLMVQASRFGIERTDIRLGEKVKSAIIMGNWFRGKMKIEAAPGVRIEQGMNVSEKPD